MAAHYVSPWICWQQLRTTLKINPTTTLPLQWTLFIRWGIIDNTSTRFKRVENKQNKKLTDTPAAKSATYSRLSVYHEYQITHSDSPIETGRLPRRALSWQLAIANTRRHSSHHVLGFPAACSTHFYAIIVAVDTYMQSSLRLRNQKWQTV